MSTFLEASNVINDPKCNKGPRCNNVLALHVIKVLSVITFGPKCNKGSNYMCNRF